MLLVVVTALSTGSHACFYSTYKFNSSDHRQTDIEDVIFERYPDMQPEIVREDGFDYRNELKRLEAEFPQKKTDMRFLDDMAVLLVRTGNNEAALALLQKMLEREPSRYETLCNLATVYHLTGKYITARDMLTSAAAQKPELRSGAEQMHVEMLEFLIRQRLDPKYGTEHLFIDQLTPFWKERGEPPGFKKAKFPIQPTRGVAELLRQFPDFGDGWLVLGMLLDNDRDYHIAKLAYNRAQKKGTGQGAGLQAYLRGFTQFEEKTDRIQKAGWGMLKLLILLGGGYILYRMGKFLSAITADRAEARRKAAAEKAGNARP